MVQELAIKVRKPAKGPNPLSMKKKKLIVKKIAKRRHKIKNKKLRRAAKKHNDVDSI